MLTGPAYWLTILVLYLAIGIGVVGHALLGGVRLEASHVVANVVLWPVTFVLAIVKLLTGDLPGPPRMG